MRDLADLGPKVEWTFKPLKSQKPKTVGEFGWEFLFMPA